jgi:26S proteasome regulatory subunit T2
MENFTPSKCMSEITKQPATRLQALKANRLKDHLLMENELLTDLNHLKIKKPNKMEQDLKFIQSIRGNRGFRVGILEERLNQFVAIVSLGSVFFTMAVHSFVNPSLLQTGARVLISPYFGIVGCLDSKESEDEILNKTLLVETPLDSFEDVGGLESQIQELKECIEWSISKSELFEEMGIQQPRGVLLYGEPGCGKTLLARAVAHSTKASFFRLSASSLIQKYLGDGPRMVRTIFKLAAKRAPRYKVHQNFCTPRCGFRLIFSIIIMVHYDTIFDFLSALSLLTRSMPSARRGTSQNQLETKRSSVP